MKQKKPPNMVLSPERARLLMELTDEDAGKVVKALVAYADTQALPEFSGVLLLCFKTLLDDIKQGISDYERMCERNRRSAKVRASRAAQSVTSCNKLSQDETACDKMPQVESCCDKSSQDETGCHKLSQVVTSCDMSPAPTGRTPLDLLMTGEDGEPIVIYKHG